MTERAIAMNGDDKSMTTSADQDLVITRVFDAPRDLVFNVWTDTEHLKKWWGPKGVTIIPGPIDLSPGGLYRFCMQSPDGFELWGRFSYREIIAPERLVFIVSLSDEKGKPIPHPMAPTWPVEIMNTVTFTEHDGRTTLTLRARPLNATDEQCRDFLAGHDNVRQGYNGTFDKLADYLANETGV